MGTTLTGTTPQDTYDSLIKVTNNGPLSSTARFLSDGLGNDSILALSTSRVGIGTTSLSYQLHLLNSLNNVAAINIEGSDQSNVRLRFSNGGAGGRNYELMGGLAGANNSNFSIFDATASATRLTIDSTGNVGIGTSTPAAKLHISDSAAVGVNITSSASQAFMNFTSVNTAGFEPFIGFGGTTAGDQAQMIGVVNGGVRWTVAGTERMRLTPNGLTFNGDTAAANALDDYEEGTWTMGISFGGGSTGVTYANTTGTYTKIGRQVTVNGFLRLTNKGSSTGAAKITGLPFTVANTTGNLAGVAVRFDSITFTNQFQAHAEDNSTTIALEEITVLGSVSTITDADFANSCSIIVGGTYFV